jgi:membrane protein required for beta-lactamase induction
MLLRIGVLVVGATYVAYRLRLALQLSQARRAGDVERERALRARLPTILRWVAGTIVVLVVLVTVLVTLSAR